MDNSKIQLKNQDVIHLGKINRIPTLNTRLLTVRRWIPHYTYCIVRNKYMERNVEYVFRLGGLIHGD